MRGHFRTTWKLATLLLTLVTCLLAHVTPALALAIYQVFVEASVSVPEPIPSGTSIVFLPGSFDFPVQFERGNAIATGSASVATPGTVSALVAGLASGPGDSQSNAILFARQTATLLNQNATTVTFPLTLSHQRTEHTSSIPLGGQTELTGAGALFSLSLDSVFLVNDSNLPCSGSQANCSSFDSGSSSLFFSLTPGSHSLETAVVASGGASVSGAFLPPLAATPEPMTLLLFGTTAAGLGLVRWRRRGRERAPAA